MIDVDTHVRRNDPLDPADPFLDADGLQARRVRARAIAVTPPPARPRAARPLALGGAIAAVLAAAVVAGLPFGSSPSDARAAMVRAAQASASYDSGRLVTTVRHTRPATDESVEFRSDLRFDGTAMGSEHTVLREGEPVHASAYRQVDGRLYERREGGPWRLAGTTDEDPSIPGQVASTRPETVVELLRLAGDVRESSRDGGGTTYTATVAAGALDDVPPSLLPLTRMGEPGRALAVTVETDAEGRLAALDLAHPGTDALTVRVEVSELGVAQDLRAPELTRAP